MQGYNQDLIGGYIHKIFHNVVFEYKPTNTLMFKQNIARSCGFYMGLMFFKCIVSSNTIETTFDYQIQSYMNSKRNSIEVYKIYIIDEVKQKLLNIINMEEELKELQELQELQELKELQELQELETRRTKLKKLLNNVKIKLQELQKLQKSQKSQKSQKYDNLFSQLNNLEEKLKTTFTREYTFNNKIFYISIPSEYIEDIRLFKDFKFSDIEYFHIFLAYIWWICNNMKGIIEYYEGLKESFSFIIAFIEDYKNKCNTKKPYNFKPPARTGTSSSNEPRETYNFKPPKRTGTSSSNEPRETEPRETEPRETEPCDSNEKKELLYSTLKKLFNPENIKILSTDDYTQQGKYDIKVLKKQRGCDDWLELLVLFYLKTYSELPIYSYQPNTKLFFNSKSYKFPDCGETSIRNLLNICFYNKELRLFDIPKKANQNLIKFYEVFRTFDDQSSSDKKNIFNEDLTSYEAWAYVVSNLDDVAYVYNTDVVKYEIECGCAIDVTKSNIFTIIFTLLNYSSTSSNISDSIKEFMSTYSCESIDVSLNNDFFGNITFIKEYVEYKLHLQPGHFFIEQTSSPIEISHIDENKVGNTYKFLDKSYDMLDNYNFIFIKFMPETIVSAFNLHILNPKNSYLLLRYIHNNFPDLIDKINLKLSKINLNAYTPHITLSDLKHYGFKLDGESIKEMKCLDTIFAEDIPDTVDTLFVNCKNIETLEGIPDNVKTLSIHSEEIYMNVNIPNGVKTLSIINVNYDLIKKENNIKTLIITENIFYLINLLNLLTLLNSLKYLTLKLNIDKEFNIDQEINISYQLANALKALTFLTLEVHIVNDINQEYINRLMELLNVESLIRKCSLKLGFYSFIENDFSLKLKQLEIESLTLYWNKIQLHNLECDLPHHLKTLELIFPSWNEKSKFHKISFDVPTSVTNLTLENYRRSFAFMSDIEKSEIETMTLKNCSILNNLKDFPKLKTLSIFNTVIKRAMYDELPSSVTTFICKGICLIKLKDIPDSVNTLHIEKYLSEDKEIKFPKNLTDLTIGHIKLLLQPGFIPKTVKNLTINLNRQTFIELKDVIPDSVETLTFGDDFNQELNPELIPDSVKKLNLPYKYDKDITAISKEGREIVQDYRSYIYDLDLPDDIKREILLEEGKSIK